MNNMLEQMLMQMMMGDPNMAGLAPGPGPPVCRCPICQDETPYNPSSSIGRLEDRCSHDARLIWVPGNCPVCMEDHEALVALHCGHALCANCFKGINGRMGEEAMHSAEQVTQEARDRAWEERREAGIPAPEDMARMLGQMFGPQIMGLDDDDEGGDDDEDFVDDEEEDDDDFDDMPPLIGPDGADVRGDGFDEGSDDDDMPALVPRRAPPAQAEEVADDASSDESLPDLMPRRAVHVDTSDEDSDVPNLQPRANNNNDDSSSSSDADIPALIPRRGNRNDDDSSSSSEDVPDLIPRQGAPCVDSSDDEKDDHAAVDGDDSSFPPPMLSRVEMDAADSDNADYSDMPRLVPRTAAPAAENDSDDEEDMPELLPRAGGAVDSSDEEVGRRARMPRAAAADSDSDDDAPPPLTARRIGMAGGSDSDEEPPPLMPRSANVEDEESEEEDELPELIGRARAPPIRTREQRLEEARRSVRNLKNSQIKRKLRSLGVPYDHLLEKSELIEAYANATVNQEQQRTTSARPAPAAAPRPPPVDPFADMPPLVPAKGLPRNGAWILANKSSSRMALQYAVCDSSSVKCQSLGEYAPESLIMKGVQDRVYLLKSAGSKMEVQLVNDSDIKLQLYTIPKVAKPSDVALDGRQAVWTLQPKGINLMALHVFNYRYEDGKELRDGIPSGSLLLSSNGDGVWLLVHNEESSSLQPGLWFVTPAGPNCLVPNVDKAALFASDGSRRGLWLLQPHADSVKSLLMHVSCDGQTQTQELVVKWSSVQAIIDAGNDETAILHYKSGSRWKLVTVTLGKAAFKELADCPRNSNILSCGKGGAWLWKKSGRAAERSLSYVDSKGTQCDYTAQRFQQGSLIA